jgi:hypothetical protein
LNFFDSLFSYSCYRQLTFNNLVTHIGIINFFFFLAIAIMPTAVPYFLIRNLVAAMIQQLQCKPLNVIALGQVQTDYINRMIIIKDLSHT